MSSSGDQDRAFERKGSEDQQLELRAIARRNRMFAEWAANRMGLESVDDYVRAVAKSEAEPPSEAEVLRKVKQDLSGSGVSVREGEIVAKMDELLAVAREQIRHGE